MKISKSLHAINYLLIFFIFVFFLIAPGHSVAGNFKFFVKKIRPVENMPLLYKTRLFRAQGHKTFDESLGRREGYKLSTLGQTIQGLLIGLFPHQFCNIYVLDAEKRIDA